MATDTKLITQKARGIKFILKFNVVVRIRINYTLKYVLITCHTLPLPSSSSSYGERRIIYSIGGWPNRVSSYQSN